MIAMYFYQGLFYGLPIGALAFFGISLYRFLSAKRRNRQEPGSYGPEEMKRRKTLLIAASVIAGVLLAVVIGFTLLLFMAVAFM